MILMRIYDGSVTRRDHWLYYTDPARVSALDTCTPDRGPHSLQGESTPD